MHAWPHMAAIGHTGVYDFRTPPAGMKRSMGSGYAGIEHTYIHTSKHAEYYNSNITVRGTPVQGCMTSEKLFFFDSFLGHLHHMWYESGVESCV